MIKRKRIVFIVAGVTVAALATIILLNFSRATYLVLTDDLSDTYLLSVRVNEQDEFSISFIHSVNISPVTEIFQIKEGRIVLTALEFYTFGAGMPTDVEPGQTLLRLPEGGMRIEGFDRVIDGLRYTSGHETEHTLQVGTQQIALDTLVSSGRPVLFEVQLWSIWQRVQVRM